ncbi:hypothetical protein R3P38DRAFT_2712577 [Favolaschia claudopus]|uniref:Uncharacterized protein n=1 Tax=Favolaschia claudopus TaxID=2862362 RepID=A0AAW0B3H6_9AGAR
MRRSGRVVRSLAVNTRSPRRFSALPKLKPAPANETLELLDATAALVPQALASNPPQLSLWNDVLSAVNSDLRSYHPRPARLVVYGTEASGARDVVTALLEQPFASDAQQAESLRQRWAKQPSEQTNLTIEHGSPAFDDSLRLPLAYLDQFPVPLQVIEGTDPALLQTADIPVIVTRLEDLHNLPITRPDTIVIVNIEDENPFPPRASTSSSPVAPTKYLFVSPSQALSALDVVRDSSASEAIQRYQTAFLASRMPTVSQTLHTALASLQNVSVLRHRTALAQIRGALAACRSSIEEARLQLDRIAADISKLDALAEEERVKVQLDVFGSPQNHAVDRALADATTMMKLKIDHMRWRRSISSIDELSSYLTYTVSRVWCLGLEKELVFHSGRLANMQRAFTARAFELLAPSNTGALHSPVLQNSLRQLTSAPTFPVSPTTLTTPLSKRSQMILDAPTSRLHVSAQRSLFGLIGTTAAGSIISWAGYIGYMINMDGIFGSLILEPATAVATGILITVSGVHWSTSKWNKARKRWWDDFTRVAGGVKQDITDTLDQVMENQVLLVARTGCTELSQRVTERKTELEMLQERLDALSLAADRLEQRR